MTLLNDVYMTGYFGIPGRQGGQIHVTKNGKPLCGQRIHPKAEFQWCAHGIYLPYVKCQRCKERGFVLEKLNWEKLEKKFLNAKKVILRNEFKRL